MGSAGTKKVGRLRIRRAVWGALERLFHMQMNDVVLLQLFWPTGVA